MSYLERLKSNIFYFNDERNILQTNRLGICADISSVVTPDESVSSMNNFQGCPITNTAFKSEVWIDGERIRAKEWHWVPNGIIRKGRCGIWEAETLTMVAAGKRAIVQKLSFTNNSDKTLTVPLQVQFQGHVRYEPDDWTFCQPKPGNIREVTYKTTPNTILAESGDCAYVITSSIEMKLFELARLWETEITIEAGETLEFFLSFHIGKTEKAVQDAKAFLGNYESVIENGFAWLERRTHEVLDNIPKFKSDNKELDDLYYRSLVCYILCRWDCEELFIPSFYSTGSVIGSCMTSYLWDYCGGLMLHPLVDPGVNKDNIKAYLNIDLTKHYSLKPVTGAPDGPWYQVNQEKIILMVYYHILHTGEIDLLFEEVNGKTVLDWMIYQAYVCDDITKPVELYDYGVGGKEHLELRRGIPYCGVMPDLNARRYMNYKRVYELTCLAGRPEERLMERAAQLKEKMKELWDDEKQWYAFLWEGKRDFRYTIQMFKFLNSPVLDEKEREGLISHINDEEFLSKFGMHSMAKHDISYDQDDIDNGGGGSCQHFVTEVCSQLYEIGKSELATDIVKRILWWNRVPYLGDSCAANMQFNREDTPLQGDVHAMNCAQMMAFWMLGIRVHFDGTIDISPAKHRPASKIDADDFKIRGKVFSVHTNDDTFTVLYDGKELSAQIGDTITI